MQISCDYVIEDEEGNDLVNGATLDLSTGVVDTDIEDAIDSAAIKKSYLMLKGSRFELNTKNGISTVNPEDVSAISKIATRGARL